MLDASARTEWSGDELVNESFEWIAGEKLGEEVGELLGWFNPLNSDEVVGNGLDYEAESNANMAKTWPWQSGEPRER